jgi:hypothetical protein
MPLVSACFLLAFTLPEASRSLAAPFAGTNADRSMNRTDNSMVLELPYNFAAAELRVPTVLLASD